ncbi:site-specific DNA-methyltransferase [uncultured Chryseobacterium sp.]|uniref:site-specific DNA-methyltransferase n=1 Tax=uncultured Chryseobacterium sp. TaxID=259322 RepID=UPI0025D73224|nr:site-specific DNA-methyltransferase [uncultured Chryseobacterium sp.]
MNDKLDLQSTDITSLNIEKIAALFPNCVTETAEGKKIDFDLLKQELSTEIVEGNKERYRLEWPGKREAIVTANIPTTKTLRPIREDSVDFDTTENIYIEGDNLEVLKLLQESYLNKIKMIYIDPPYNTGKDFVYKDNFVKDGNEELFESGQKDEHNQRLVANPETSGRYHSDWLSMMYPRLKLARNLLTEDGVIFISIDDNEVNNLQKICNDIFGEGNFVAKISVLNNPKGRVLDKYIATCHEYLLIYSKYTLKTNSLSVNKDLEKIKKDYPLEDGDGQYRELELRNTHREFGKHNRPKLYYPFYVLDGNISLTEVKNSVAIFPNWEDGFKGCWTWGKEKAKEELVDLVAKQIKGSWKIYRKSYANRDGEAPQSKLKSIWTEKEFHTEKGQSTFNNIFETKEKLFQSPKSVDYLKKLIEMTLKSTDIILDFFSGSATTAHAVMQLNAEDVGNRKYIMVQLPEATDEKSEAYKAGYKNICEIGKERIRRAANKIKENTNRKILGLDLGENSIGWATIDGNKKIKSISSKTHSEGSRDEISANSTDIIEKEIIKNSSLDLGFRVYRLDSSNMQDVYYKPQDYSQGMLDLFADNVKEGRTAEDLVTQVMLDWGLPLSLPIEPKTVSGKEVYAVAGDSLYCCFDDGIDEDFAKEIAQEKPLRIVFRDKGFKNDTAKENVKQLLKQLSIGTEMRVI